MKYYIGVDGGGSHSRAVLIDDQLKLVRRSEGRGLNPLAVSWEGFWDHLMDLLGSLQKDLDAGSIKGVCAGLAGTGSESVRHRAEDEIRAITGAPTVIVISDALAALWGAFGGNPGLLLIAGTGSICLGTDEHVNIQRSGGFGRLLGDEGSGYWMAIEAIRLGLLHDDGRGGSGSLKQIVLKEFGLKELREIIPKIHGGDFTPDRVAVLAERIVEASTGDPHAAEIISKAGGHLADLVVTTAMKLNLTEPRLALWGGLWKAPNAIMQTALSTAIERAGKKVNIFDPLETPEWGAIRYLLKGNG
jgi:glucosamine kinase